MRRLTVVVVFLFVLLTTSAMADGLVSKGVSVVFNAGSSKDQWQSSLIFTGSESGALFPANGELVILPGETVYAQMNFTKAHGPKAFDFFWEIGALTTKKNKFWNQSELDPNLGWLVEITPADYAAATQSKLPVPLQLRVTKKNGKNNYVRVIFKVTYSEDSVREHDLLMIRVVEPATESSRLVPPSVPCEQIEGDINETRSAVVAFSEQLADHTTEDASAHDALIEDAERQDRNIQTATNAADDAGATAKANSERLDAVEAYLESLGEPTAPSVETSDPFRIVWIDNGGKTMERVCIRYRQNGRVMQATIPGVATYATLVDGARVEVRWLAPNGSWEQHLTTARRGETDRILYQEVR